MDVETIVNSLLTAVELVAATLLFASGLPRRGAYAARVAIATIALALVIGTFMDGIASPGASHLFGLIVLYAVALVLCSAIVGLCHEATTWTILFCATAGYATQNLASGVMGFINRVGGWVPSEYVFYVITNLVEYALVYMTIYLVMVRRMNRNGLVVEEDHGMLFMVLVVIFAVIGLDVCIKSSYVAGIDFPTFITLRIVHALVCAFVLFAEYQMLYKTRLKTEMAESQQLLHDERRQYRLSKETVESINVKCHDIRHQIRHMADGLGAVVVDPLIFDDIAKEVRVYDSTVSTGNDALDVILSEKSLVCERRGIALSCMADGSAISFMQPTEIYSLFGNALENAIEAVGEVPNPEKRRIALVLRSDMGMASLHVENYFVGSLEFVGGLPKSTKGDDANHGFGMRSMERTAQRYGGTLVASTRDDLFLLDVAVPQPELPTA
ncbi:hypothetical protein AUL39_02740 [Tractidigestivibacter scatoligenes]|jgi:hypothetical protein|uniref:Sensor histidine kinase NatK-like C-terminal domain-containing protein n=1 Tax=Tractidigestivibacter scatoligenes TaxID=1299998 RepID=A0A117J581_TRASO|nr:ATP-binding protein [Tractidigestivibacter scatoligenes]KUH59263.1 hypothetical protein AUL39_02740 [Tractidigestivibacter scatoligenes]